MTLAICICTFKRPEGLTRLLLALSDLYQRHPFTVFVVDNHKDMQGLLAAEKLQVQGLPYSLSLEASEGAGISHARNQVLQSAIDADADFAALIDDDEWPSQEWLSELLRVRALSNADAVGGPTHAVFVETPDDLLKQSIYYGADLGLAENAPCTLEACGNVLLKLEPLAELTQPLFDPELGQSGGEDLTFFKRLEGAGMNMRWAPEAIVYEEVPAERSTYRWLKLRVALIANARVHTMKKLEPGVAASCIRLAKTAALAAQACLMSLAGLVHSQMRYQGLIHRAKLKGKIRAHLGQRLTRGENH